MSEWGSAMTVDRKETTQDQDTGPRTAGRMHIQLQRQNTETRAEYKKKGNTKIKYVDIIKLEGQGKMADINT